MDWLRCNKCYILMSKRTRNFVMTQCGHVFCDLCLSKCKNSRDPTKCQECGTADFRSLELTWPPKLETVMNYFSSATDFAQQATTFLQFSEEQLTISMRGFEELAKKYEQGKRTCTELVKEIEKGTLRNMKLREAVENSGASMRVQEVRSAAEPRRGLRATTEPMVTCETPQQPRVHGARDGPIGSSVRRGVGTGHVNLPAGAKASQPMSRAGSSRATSEWTPQPPPKYPYHPHPAFTSTSRVSVAAMFDSGCETAVEDSTPTSIVQENFAVPSTQRVPRSVASTRRKARTLPRLSAPKTDRS